MPLVCSDFGGSVVLDAKCSAKLVEVVLARGGTHAQAKEPAGELFSVVCMDLSRLHSGL